MPPRALPVNHLRLEEADDRLSESIVVRITATPDRWRDTSFRQPIAVAHRNVLGAPIAVMDQAAGAGAAAVVNGLLQRIEHEVGRQRRRHAPPDNAAREDV